MPIDFRAGINKIESELNNASKNAANKNMNAALALGEINTKQFLDIKKLLKAIGEYDVLVGIPDATTARQNGEITNAELAFIHTHGVTKAPERQKIEEHVEQGMNYRDARKLVHQLYLARNGSPAWKIPPRPIIEPAIEDSKKDLAKMLKLALQSFLKVDIVKGERQLKATGIKAQNVVRAWFTNPKNNWPPNSPVTVMIKTKGKGGVANPLIDTGELRKSITYVIRKPSGNRIINRIKKTTEKAKAR